MMHHKANGDLNLYGELLGIQEDLALYGEPETITVRTMVDGLVCRVCDEQWPGHPVPALAPTRYDAVETATDSNVTIQQREGGQTPIPSPSPVNRGREIANTHQEVV